MRPYGPASPWRFAPGLTYLTHGTFGACPVPVLEAQRSMVDELEANPVAFLDTTFEARLDAARRTVAAFLGADPAGLVFVPNPTTAVSAILRSIRFRPGDEILSTNHEYNATRSAAAIVAGEAGATVVDARLPLEIPSSAAVLEAVLAAVGPRTRLALVSHVTSPTATILPIADIVRELDARGVDTIVDAAHAPGQVPVDVAGLGAAYWTGNGHKWLCGPKSSAMLVVREDRRAAVRPLVMSHGWNDPRTDRSAYWKEFDWTGTTDPIPYLCLPEAIRVVGGLDPDGWPGIMAGNHDLVVAGRRAVARALELEPRVPESLVGSMAIVPLPMAPEETAIDDLKRRLLDEEGIEVPVVGFPVRAARARPSDLPSRVGIRLSAQRYNEPQDFERLADALARRLR